MDGGTTVERMLRSIGALTGRAAQEFDGVREMARSCVIPAGGHFLRAGDIPRSFAFVVSGLFRYYYMDAEGNEFTKGFFPEGSFITAYSAVVEERGSHFSIEALEDSALVVIDYRRWKEMSRNNLAWTTFLLALLEKGYCIKEHREKEFLLCSAEERYQSFLKRYPGLESRIRQHHVASYLGITAVSLSRIRRALRSA